MPSPTCTINGAATAGGVNVSATSTVTIQLLDLSAYSWQLSVIGTDDSYGGTPPTLTVNNTTKTATYTSGMLGSAVLFNSTVKDAQGNASSTTFAAYVLTATGLRVLSMGESLEANANYGWISQINTNIRTGAPNATGSIPGVVQLTHDFGGTYSAPTVVGVNGHALSGAATDVLRGDGTSGAVPAAALPAPAAATRGGVALPSTASNLYYRDDGSFGTPGFVQIAMPDTDLTLTAGQAANYVLYFSGTITAYRNVILPLTAGRHWWIINLCSGFGLNFKGSTGGYATIGSSSRGLIVTDGTGFVQ